MLKRLVFPALVSGLTLLGFALRLEFIQRNIFHPDEFISYLAITRILELGAPIFPSTQFYDHGILFSYVAAAFSALAGPAEFNVRWVSLIFGVLFIPLAAKTAEKYFHSAPAGLFAGLVIAIYPATIYWSGRMRMYALAEFCYLLGLALLCLGVVQAKRKWRLTAYLALFAGMFSHLALIVTVPALAVAAGSVLALQGRLPWRTPRQALTKPVLLEGVLIVALLGGAFLWGQAGFIAQYSASPDTEQGTQTAAVTSVIESVITLSGTDRALDSLNNYFFGRSENRLLSGLALLGGAMLLVMSVISYRKRKPFSERDLTAVFILLTAVSLLLIIIFLLSGQWRNGRYYFIWLLPLLILLASYTVAQLEQFLRRFGTVPAYASTLLLAIAVSVTIIPATTKELTEDFKTYRYDLGWQYVAENKAPEDSTLTAWPSAAYLYGPGVDYYTNEEVPVVMRHPQAGTLTDRYVGAPFIEDAARFTEILDAPGQTWFVVEDGRLFNFFEAPYAQQILYQLEYQTSFDNIHVFREKADRRPLPRQKTADLTADFSGILTLTGYTLQPQRPQPGQPAFLTLFWRPAAASPNHKIFVHVRDANGGNVAQADFIPLENEFVDFVSWVDRAGAGELLRTPTVLWLPAELPPGEYDLFAGVYDGLTFERLPVTNDQTGENAVWLGQVQVGP